MEAYQRRVVAEETKLDEKRKHMGKVPSLPIAGKTGIRKNISDLIEALDVKKLKAIAILYESNDGIQRVFLNGEPKDRNFLLDGGRHKRISKTK